MTIAAIILLALTIGLAIAAVVTFRNVGDRGEGMGMPVIFASLTILMLTCSLIAGWLALAPEYRLHKASIEKRILVEQAKAEADAAIEEARAEIERAKGTAEANKIVDASITEPYLRYLYINSLKDTDNQVIYLPTEAGLPVLEAGRLDK